MDIKVIQEGQKTIFAIVGRVDTITAPKLREYTDSLIEQGVPDIEIDMTDCEFVSSAGLRVFATLRKYAVNGNTLVIRGVQPEVMDVFELTGFNKILTFV